MRVTVRLFARLREIAGATEMAREVAPGATIGGVWRQLASEFPELGPYERSISSARQRRLRTNGHRASRRRRGRVPAARLRRVTINAPRALTSRSRDDVPRCQLCGLRCSPVVYDVRQTGRHRAAVRDADAAPRHDRGAERFVRLPEAREDAGGDRADRPEVQGIQGDHRGSRADRGAGLRRRRRHARPGAPGAQVARVAPRRAPRRAQDPARPQGSERSEERHARDPRRHGRRRGGALRGRAVSDVQQVRGTSGLEDRRALEQRDRRRRPEGSHRHRSRGAAPTAS